MLSHFVPDDFTPSEAERTAASRLGVNVDAECEKFKDHEFRKPHSDWHRAFRRWLRNAPTFNGKNGKPDDEDAWLAKLKKEAI